MRRFFATIALLFGLATPAQAEEANPDCTDERCKASLNPQALRPDVRDKVCIFFRQPESGIVVLTLTLENGTLRIYSRPKEQNDKFCIGRQWVQQSVRIELCNNSSGSAEYSAADTEVLARKLQYSKQLTGCLHGKAACAKMVLP